jgi:hypothetical protein
MDRPSFVSSSPASGSFASIQSCPAFERDLSPMSISENGLVASKTFCTVLASAGKRKSGKTFAGIKSSE